MMMRSISAIAIGFLLIGGLSFGADAVLRQLYTGAWLADGSAASTGVLLLVILYVAVFAIGGCYLTARLAPQNPMRHALILGTLGFAFTAAGTAATWATAPVWYHTVSLLLVMPYAWAGGRLREVQLRAQPVQRQPAAPAA